MEHSNDTLLQQFLQQQKRDRRWRNLRFLIGIGAILFIIFGAHIGSPDQPRVADPHKPYVSLVRMNGAISSSSSFSAAHIIPEIERAFKDKQSKGIILLINSPGGSPVQASIIHDRIIDLKKQYPQKKVAVVAEDALASGAYLVAVAADKIYVNPDTLTGSIGVVMRGFGFKDAIAKLGITRRVFTSGNEKSRLDAFAALNPKDISKVKNVLDQVHAFFIQDVKAGRGKRLHGNDKQLFSGDFWTGSQAVKLGLADANANLWQVMAQYFKVQQYKDYTSHPSLLQNALKNISSKLTLDFLTQSEAQLQA